VTDSRARGLARSVTAGGFNSPWSLMSERPVQEGTFHFIQVDSLDHARKVFGCNSLASKSFSGITKSRP